MPKYQPQFLFPNIVIVLFIFIIFGGLFPWSARE